MDITEFQMEKLRKIRNLGGSHAIVTLGIPRQDMIMLVTLNLLEAQKSPNGLVLKLTALGSKFLNEQDRLVESRPVQVQATLATPRPVSAAQPAPVSGLRITLPPNHPRMLAQQPVQPNRQNSRTQSAISMAAAEAKRRGSQQIQEVESAIHEQLPDAQRNRAAFAEQRNIILPAKRFVPGVGHDPNRQRPIMNEQQRFYAGDTGRRVQSEERQFSAMPAAFYKGDDSGTPTRNITEVGPRQARAGGVAPQIPANMRGKISRNELIHMADAELARSYAPR